MIYGLGLGKVDRVRSETETARRGPESGRAAKKGFSAKLLIADGCQNCSHPPMHGCERVYSFAFNLNICLLGTRRRRRRCRVSFIF